MKKFIYSFIILLLLTHSFFGFEQQKSNATIVNLQDKLINRDTEIDLDSGWEFYWNEFIVPGKFKAHKPSGIVSLTDWTKFNISDHDKLPSFGYATYRLLISTPKKKPAISLYIPRIYAASKIWINGKFISETGRISKNKKDAIHRRFSQIIPLNSNETEFEVVIHVSNFYHSKGGIDNPVILGASHHIHNKKHKQIIADMLFIGCLSFMGCFFLFFYVFYWNKDEAILFFAILCLSLSYMALSDRYAPFTEVFGTISWVFLTKIEYISLFLAGTSASLFFNDIFSKFIHKKYIKIITYSFLFLVIATIIIPVPYVTKIILPFFGLMIINILYVTFIILKAFLSKKHESILLLVIMLMGSTIFSVHIFLFIGKNENAIIYINFGYIAVFLLFSMLLMVRFSNSFKELEKSKNLALQQKKEISLQSSQLTKANLQLEENLKLLENYNTELDDFNHIVSHDLKSPLVSIYSLVSFIEEDLKPTLDENTKNHMHLLKGVVSKMEALINGLLEYSKVAKGNKKKELFSFNDLMTQVMSIVDYQNKSTIILPTEDVEIYANKIELDHVFQNLISNAIKHNDKERAIINVSVSKLDNEYLFAVTDNGPGIEPEYHTKIFKIFSQLKLNDDVNSTGIGLAIVKKIITENNGIISIDSEKNAGMTIKFSWEV